MVKKGRSFNQRERKKIAEKEVEDYNRQKIRAKVNAKYSSKSQLSPGFAFIYEYVYR